MNQDKIWDFFQTKQPQMFYSALTRQLLLIRIVKNKFKSISNIKVLNIGAGSGDLELIGIKQGLNMYSLDPSAETIRNLQQKGLGNNAVVGYSQNNPFPSNFFHAVCVAEVLEHLDKETLEKTLCEINRVLVPGGFLLGTVPSKEDFDSHIVICPECGEKFHRWGHFQSFDTKSIINLLQTKFEICEVKEKLLLNTDTLNWKGKIHYFLKTLLLFFGIHGTNEKIVFVVKKTV